MCGRFALTATTKDIEKLRPKINSDFEIVPNKNISPGSEIVIIKNSEPDILDKAIWGLIPYWAKDLNFGSKLFNARSETLEEKASFKNSFKKRRCLIPANSFFEWKAVDQNSKKQKYEINCNCTHIFFFAGLWDLWKSHDYNTIVSATIITCEPNNKMSNIHNRMPVILISNEEQEIWISDTQDFSQLKSLLKPIDDNFINISLSA